MPPKRTKAKNSKPSSPRAQRVTRQSTATEPSTSSSAASPFLSAPYEAQPSSGEETEVPTIEQQPEPQPTIDENMSDHENEEGVAPTATQTTVTLEMVNTIVQNAIEADRAQRAGERTAASVREALAESLRASRPDRKKNLMEKGKLTSTEAELELTESDARALRGTESTSPRDSSSWGSDRRSPVRADDLKEFDGNPLKLFTWLSHVEALYNHRLTRDWQDSIVTLLPLCLRDAADHWYSLLSPEDRLKLTTWHEWKDQLTLAFKPDQTELRRLADARKWVVRKELVQSYYYEKVALLKAAYPARDDRDFVIDVKSGLPSNMQISVRTNLCIKPTLSALLTELRGLEGPYRAESPSTRSLLLDVDSTPAPPTVPTYAKETPSSSSVSGNRRPPLADTYVRKNIWTTADGDRHYRIPGSDRKISLGARRCKECNGKHFDFEHRHLVGTPKKEAMYVEGYLTSAFDPMDVDDEDLYEEDEGFTILEADDSTISNSSNNSSRSRSTSPVTNRSVSPSTSRANTKSSEPGKGSPTSA